MPSLFNVKAVALAALLLTGAVQAQTYGKPQVVVPPSNFKGVHGLAVDKQGRLLGGSVVGMSITQVDQQTRKMSPHGGWLMRDFIKHKEVTLACPPRWAQMPLTATSWQRSLRI